MTELWYLLTVLGAYVVGILLGYYLGQRAERKKTAHQDLRAVWRLAREAMSAGERRLADELERVAAHELRLRDDELEAIRQRREQEEEADAGHAVVRPG